MTCTIFMSMCVAPLTLRGHQQVDALQDVEEELVAAVLDALAPPADLARHLAGDLRLLLLCLEEA